MQISFSNPGMLWFFLGIPFLVLGHFIALRFTEKRAIRFANFEALARVTHTKLRTNNIGVLILRIIMLALIILAASGTKVTYNATVPGFDYIIALDTSV